MTKLILMIFMLAPFTAMAQGFYGSMSTDISDRHSMSFGYQMDRRFSFEASYNTMDGDGSKTRLGDSVEQPAPCHGQACLTRNVYKADKTQATIFWTKFQRDYGRDLILYSKVGVGRFEVDVDTFTSVADKYYGKTRSRTRNKGGHGFAIGAEYSMTKNIYSLIEYQYFRVNSIGPVRERFNHSDGGAVLGLGYKF